MTFARVPVEVLALSPRAVQVYALLAVPSRPQSYAALLTAARCSRRTLTRALNELRQAGVLGDNVPVALAPGAGDATGLDFAAATAGASGVPGASTLDTDGHEMDISGHADATDVQDAEDGPDTDGHQVDISGHLMATDGAQEVLEEDLPSASTSDAGVLELPGIERAPPEPERELHVDGQIATAHELVALYAETVAAAGATPNQRSKGQVGQIAARLLRDGVDPAAIEAGIRTLVRQQGRGAHLTVQQLPELVTQAELLRESQRQREPPPREPEPERDPQALDRLRELRERIGRSP